MVQWEQNDWGEICNIIFIFICFIVLNQKEQNLLNNITWSRRLLIYWTGQGGDGYIICIFFMAQLSVFVWSFIPLFILWPPCYFPLLQFSLGGVVAPLLSAADEAHLTCIIITPHSKTRPLLTSSARLVRLTWRCLVSPATWLKFSWVIQVSSDLQLLIHVFFFPAFSCCVSCLASWREAFLCFTLQQAFRLFFLVHKLWMKCIFKIFPLL